MVRTALTAAYPAVVFTRMMLCPEPERSISMLDNIKRNRKPLIYYVLIAGALDGVDEAGDHAAFPPFFSGRFSL